MALLKSLPKVLGRKKGLDTSQGDGNRKHGIQQMTPELFRDANQESCQSGVAHAARLLNVICELS